jgi:hypothetical protein
MYYFSLESTQENNLRIVESVRFSIKGERLDAQLAEWKKDEEKAKAWKKLCLDRQAQFEEVPKGQYPCSIDFLVSCLRRLCGINPSLAGTSHIVRDFEYGGKPGLRSCGIIAGTTPSGQLKKTGKSWNASLQCLGLGSLTLHKGRSGASA